jgi:hypothetical protein
MKSDHKVINSVATTSHLLQMIWRCKVQSCYLHHHQKHFYAEIVGEGVTPAYSLCRPHHPRKWVVHRITQL